MTTNMRYGPDPIFMTCPFCHNPITTVIKTKPNKKTHIIALILCLLGGCCCSCLIPYCIPSCKDKLHYCPRCDTYLGTYTK